MLYVSIGQIQLRSEIVFIGQIQPWSWWETKDRYQEQAFFSKINFSDTEAGPFFDTKDFGHKGLPSKRNSSKMRGKKALGLICGWPSRGGWKEMTSDMAQVTKQGSEVNIKCAFSPQNVKYLHPFLYTVQFYFSSWKSLNKKTLTIKRYFCWSFSNYIFEF